LWARGREEKENSLQVVCLDVKYFFEKGFFFFFFFFFLVFLVLSVYIGRDKILVNLKKFSVDQEK